MNGQEMTKQLTSYEKYLQEFPQEVKHLPETEFYAILLEESVSESTGYDEQPYQTKKVWKLQVCKSREDWELVIKQLQNAVGLNHKEFKAVKITPAKITTIIKVE